MPVTDPYANATRYHSIIGSTSSAADAEINLQLAGLSRLLENEVFGGRFFTKDGAVTVRRYYAQTDFSRTLEVQDIADTAGLIVKVDDNRDGTAETVLTNVTDFELLPLNAAVGPEPKPYTALFLPQRTTRRYWYIDRLIEVTAIHGWPAIPDAIVQYTCQLLGILRLDSPRATQRIQEGIAAVIGASPAAASIVERLARGYALPAWVR